MEAAGGGAAEARGGAEGGGGGGQQGEPTAAGAARAARARHAQGEVFSKRAWRAHNRLSKGLLENRLMLIFVDLYNVEVRCST